MINWESLLEFEAALASTGRPTPLLRQSLDAKLSERITTKSNTELNFQDLDDIFNAYSAKEDQFSSCIKCGTSLTNTTKYKKCCNNYLESNSCISSSLEKSYWLSFINNPSGTINTLPQYTQLLLLQQGVPRQLRQIVWKRLLLVGGDEIPVTSQHIFDNFQHSYHPGIAKQIEKDLTRTFPSIEFFQQEETIKNLSTILNVYANYNATLGYCQGLLFLVGVLYYHFQNESPAFTFHALVVIMQSESELHDIFTASTMSKTLQKWLDQFMTILNQVDPELFKQLNKIGIESQVFLYQWWLSFSASHIPDVSIIDRVMDICLVQGWKVGLFKVSLGLLTANKPLLMTMNEGDEEVVYQHLLNESRWGVAIKDLDMFFGSTLMGWDDELFMFEDTEDTSLFVKPNIEVRKQTPSVIDCFKQLSIGLSRPRSNSGDSPTERCPQSASSSLISVFDSTNSNANEQNSIYSDVTSTHSNDDSPGVSSVFGIKFGGGNSTNNKNCCSTPTNASSTSSSTLDNKEREYLKDLLGKALGMLEGGERNTDIIEDIRKVVEEV